MPGDLLGLRARRLCYCSEDLDRTERLRLLSVLLNFPSRVKYAVNLQGRDVGNARRPNAPLSHEDQVAIRNEVEKIGLLQLPIA